MDLTKRQQEIFDFIRKYSAKYGYPPTVRDIGKAVGLASSSTVHAHLANLEKIGLLRRDPSKPRAIELLDRAVGGAVETVRGIVRPTGFRCSARSPPASRCSPRRTSRSTSPCPSWPVAATASTCCDPRRVDEGRRHPRGRLRRRAPAGHCAGRRHRRRAPWRGGHGQALLPRGRPRAPSARERGDGADPQQGGQGARACRRACSGASERLARASGASGACGPSPSTAALCAAPARYGWRAGQAAAAATRPSRKVRTSQGKVVE